MFVRIWDFTESLTEVRYSVTACSIISSNFFLSVSLQTSSAITNVSLSKWQFYELNMFTTLFALAKGVGGQASSIMSMCTSSTFNS